MKIVVSLSAASPDISTIEDATGLLHLDTETSGTHSFHFFAGKPVTSSKAMGLFNKLRESFGTRLVACAPTPYKGKSSALLVMLKNQHELPV